MSAKRTKRASISDKALRGQVDLPRLRRMTEAEIEATSPPELKNLPADFWDDAVVVWPKEAISLRVDQDVLAWFRAQGPRYQSRINAVLRTFMSQAKRRRRPRAGSA